MRLFCAILLCCAAPAFAQPISPEQERLSVVKLLQQRLPGTGPSDWVEGGRGAEPGVAVIALSSDNATNTHDILAIGKKAWDRKFRNGKTLATCFPNAGRRVAAGYPQVDNKTGEIVTLDSALRECYQKNGEGELATDATLGPLVAYTRTLSEGQRMNVRVSGAAAQEHFDAGRRSYYQRMGQQNYTCASCHIQHAGKIFAEHNLSPVVGQAVTWPRVAAGDGVRSLQQQMQRCIERSGAEPFALGSLEMNQLEYYVAYLSNNLPIRPLVTVR